MSIYVFFVPINSVEMLQMGPEIFFFVGFTENRHACKRIREYSCCKLGSVPLVSGVKKSVFCKNKPGSLIPTPNDEGPTPESALPPTLSHICESSCPALRVHPAPSKTALHFQSYGSSMTCELPNFHNCVSDI